MKPKLLFLLNHKQHVFPFNGVATTALHSSLVEATAATTNGSIVVRGGGSEVPEVVAKDIDDDVGSNKLVMKLVKNGVQWWPHH